MSNSCIITTRENFENNGVGVYLHWNGGRDSVEAFLKYCELRGFRTPDTDCLGWARLVQVIANFFGNDGLSVGINTIDRLSDYLDNGVYIIKGWYINDREDFTGKEQQEYPLNEMLHAIDENQPEPMGDYIDAVDVPVETIKVGDYVFIRTWKGEIKEVEILGFGEDIVVNGTHVKGLPYAEIVGGDLGKNNINNYITAKTVKKLVNPRKR